MTMMIKLSSISLSLLLSSLTPTSSSATAPLTKISSTGKKLFQFPILPHHAVINRQIRELEQQSNKRSLFTNDSSSKYGYDHIDTLEVNGLYQGYGTHYVDLWVGTPPQRQTVIVDTGSGITAFPCEECSDCGDKFHIDQYFQESQSSSFVKFGCSDCINARCRKGGNGGNGGGGEYCHLSVSYQEGSMWNAYQGQDVTYVGGMHEYFVTSDNNNEEEEEGDGTDTNSNDVDEEENENDVIQIDDDAVIISNYSENEPVEGKSIAGVIHGENPLNAADYKFDMVFGCQTKITGLFKTQLVSI